MKCLIVDDEPLARVLLEKYVNRVEGLSLVKSFPNAVEAFSFLQHTPVDLLLLDIQMPQITGLELISSLKQKPRVIFTTAHRDYAYEAYDLDAVDYLLKPIAFDRFLRSISKVYQLYQPPATIPEQPEHLKTYEDAHIYLKDGRTMVKVLLEDIVYIESLRDYIRVKTTGKQVVSYQKIGYMEHKLPTKKFMRVHRSYIVSLDKVTSYTMNHVQLNEVEVPIGRLYKKQVLKVLNRNNYLAGTL
ncbi:MAG: response regulator transcription factor [Cyclobacteriaceae bacterium]|nr:response regulator transcription factor [Cyclobacteriaceae bacterium]